MRFHRILVFSFYDQKKAPPGKQPFTFQQTASDNHPGFGGRFVLAPGRITLSVKTSAPWHFFTPLLTIMHTLDKIRKPQSFLCSAADAKISDSGLNQMKTAEEIKALKEEVEALNKNSPISQKMRWHRSQADDLFGCPRKAIGQAIIVGA